MLAQGTNLNGYTILRHIGSGGFGDVYCCEEVSSGNLVALKICRNTNPELQILRQLQHPAIVPVIDHFVHDGQHVTVMEFIDGPSLAQLLNPIHRTSRSRMSLREVIRRAHADDCPIKNSNIAFSLFGTSVIRDIAQALAHAHSRGICHRDVKPENVLITREGYGRLIDWGVAGRVGVASEFSGGTLAYMSPAALRRLGGLQQSPEATVYTEPQDDLFSLGAMLYEVWAGDLPWQTSPIEASAESAARKALPDRTGSAATVRRTSGLPAAIRQMVAACLSPNEDAVHSYKSTTQLAEDLDCFLRKRATVCLPESGLARLQRYWAKFRPPILTVAAVLFVGIVGLTLDRWHTAHQLDLVEEYCDRQRASAEVIDAVPDDIYDGLISSGLFPDSSAINARRAELCHRTGTLLVEFGNAEEGMKLFVHSAELSGMTGDLQNDIGIAAYRLGQTTRAIEAFTAALKLHPESPSIVLTNRGFAYGALNKLNEAEQDFEEALRLEPNNSRAAELLQRVRELLR